MSFWDGTRWVPEAHGPATRAGSRWSNLIANATAVLMTIALVVPFAASLATTTSGPSLTLSPTSGPAGSSVTVTGTGFQARTKVQLTWDGVSTGLPKTTTSRKGTIQVTMTVPKTKVGEHALGVVGVGSSSNAAAVSPGNSKQGSTSNSKQAPATASDTVIATATFDETAAEAPTPTPDPTATPKPTPTPTPKPTPDPTATPKPTPDPTATPTPTAQPTATPTSTPAPTATATPTATPTPTAAPAATPTATPTAAPTATPTAAPTATPTAAPTATPAATPTATPTAPTTTPTPTPAPIPTPTAPPVTSFPTDTTLAFQSTPSVARPAYLLPVTDPVLGTITTRVSNIAGARQAYSRISAWNADGSKILLGFTYPGRMLDGQTYADLGAFYQISGAIWSNVDPNKLYGVDASGNGNRFYSQNATTGALTVLHSFTGYVNVTIGDGEGGISDDDRTIVLIGTTSTGARHLIVYDLVSATVVGDVVAPPGTDNAQISRKGNYVVVVGADSRRYMRNLSSSIVLYPYGNHGDNALDANGIEIYVTNNAPGVRSYRLSDGLATTLLAAGTAFEYGHASGRSLNRPGWIYLSVYDNSVTAGRPGNDEIVALKTDGSGTVEVFAFAHHTDTVNYSMQTHAVPSPNGTSVLFASEWGGSSVFAYIASR